MVKIQCKPSPTVHVLIHIHTYSKEQFQCIKYIGVNLLTLLSIAICEPIHFIH